VDKEGEVRRTTIRTLSEIGEPAIPSLIKGLRSDHPLAEKYFTLEGTSRRFYVWDSSKRVLGKIGEKAIPALTEALKSDDAMQRVKAAASLEIVGEPAAASSVSILIDGMKDEEWQVRRTFLRCLSTIAPNDPAVKSLITKTANDDQDERVRRAAEDVLKKTKEDSASKEGA
jgi:HEAT repeat protein